MARIDGAIGSCAWLTLVAMIAVDLTGPRPRAIRIDAERALKIVAGELGSSPHTPDVPDSPRISSRPSGRPFPWTATRSDPLSSETRTLCRRRHRADDQDRAHCDRSSDGDERSDIRRPARRRLRGRSRCDRTVAEQRGSALRAPSPEPEPRLITFSAPAWRATQANAITTERSQCSRSRRRAERAGVADGLRPPMRFVPTRTAYRSRTITAGDEA